MEPLDAQMLERMARNLCAIRGVNPDAFLAYNGHNSYECNQPIWQLQIDEIVRTMQVLEAIRMEMPSGTA